MKWFLISIICIVVILLVIFIMLVFVMMIRLINMKKSKITTKNGIDENSYVKLGGIQQHIKIVGEDEGNPIILILHGGPGMAIPYMEYYCYKYLESDYTIVHWDQRGSGRTYYANVSMRIENELSVDILLNDLDELIGYLAKRFDKKKIIIMGQSWGTVLGSIYSLRHPEKLEAYIAVGQVVDFYKGDCMAISAAIEAATKAGKTEDINELNQLLTGLKRVEDIKKLDNEASAQLHTLIFKYLSCDGVMSMWGQIWTGITSPNMTLRDLRWFMNISTIEKSIKFESPLLEFLFCKLDLYAYGTQYKVPVYFISGDHDWTTPYPLVEEYYNTITADKKKLILIENTGHAPYVDNPIAFCEGVKTVLNYNAN